MAYKGKSLWNVNNKPLKIKIQGICWWDRKWGAELFCPLLIKNDALYSTGSLFPVEKFWCCIPDETGHDFNFLNSLESPSDHSK